MGMLIYEYEYVYAYVNGYRWESMVTCPHRLLFCLYGHRLNKDKPWIRLCCG